MLSQDQNRLKVHTDNFPTHFTFEIHFQGARHNSIKLFTALHQNEFLSVKSRRSLDMAEFLLQEKPSPEK